MCMASGPNKKSEDDYRAEDDLRTLTRAEEIRGDGSRMKACSRVHRRQKAAMTRTNRMFARGSAVGRGGRRG